MGYLILNGRKSDEIKGLMIQSLPAITKPLLRTEIEEIDGRDGDLITPLGYSAYDREVSIGLFGDYDIDKVIEYFDSEGEVIFSNELDKIYKYKVIEQIDFERLLRYRTATVTFHVQPFKYSAIEDGIRFDNSLLSIPDGQWTKNGLTVYASNGRISFTGTGASTTEFYVPINAVELEAGRYNFTATAGGSGYEAVKMRIIKNTPSAGDSLGHSLTFADSRTCSVDSEISEGGEFKYLWISINSGVSITAYFDLSVSAYNVSVINRGNTYAKPVLTLYGDGEATLAVNGKDAFVVNIPTYITIDSESMEAYRENALMNRYVNGDYSNLALKAGKNVISWTGSITRVDIDRYSRWI